MMVCIKRQGEERRSGEERSEGDWKVKGVTGRSDRREEHVRALYVCVDENTLQKILNLIRPETQIYKKKNLTDLKHI